MTRDEALAAREEIDKLFRPYEARTANPALRPPGAHPVEWATFAAPIAEWAPDGTGPSPHPSSEGEP